MSSISAAEGSLRRVVEVLEGYADELILIGGWVPYLHLTYGRAAVPSPRTSLTTEADLLLSTRLRRGTRRPIADLLREAGFARGGPGGVVWIREAADGSEIVEFIQRLRGPAANRGAPGAVPDQPKLTALRLDHLGVLDEFTERVRLPSGPGYASIEVCVPLLAAFVLNKANTFHLRGGEDAELKAGKDLLYLRDIAAAGARPSEVLEEDLSTIAGGRGHAATIRRAAYHLRNVAGRYHRATAEILAERDGLDLVGAMADVEGHLLDVTAWLEEEA